VDTEAALRSAWSKCSRADEHLRVFNKTVDEFFETEPYGFRRHFDVDGTEEVFRIEVRHSPPDWLPLLCGDVLHNARDALDHAVYGLATENEPTLSDSDRGGLQFPIVGSSHDFKQQKRRGRLCGVPAHQRTAIQRLQPYHQGWVNVRLGALASLNNTDKHREVHVVATSTSYVASSSGGNQAIFPSNAFLDHDDAEIMRFRLSEPYVKVDEFHPVFHLAIEAVQFPIGGIEAAKDSLSAIVSAVRETLLRLA
jgi:hypothetical protein